MSGLGGGLGSVDPNTIAAGFSLPDVLGLGASNSLVAYFGGDERVWFSHKLTTASMTLIGGDSVSTYGLIQGAIGYVEVTHTHDAAGDLIEVPTSNVVNLQCYRFFTSVLFSHQTTNAAVNGPYILDITSPPFSGIDAEGAGDKYTFKVLAIKYAGVTSSGPGNLYSQSISAT